MQHVTDIRPVSLQTRAIHRIQDGLGLRVTCFQGTVWITQQDDARDTILAAGQSFVLDHEGTTIVFALQEAAIHVGPADQIAVVATRARAA